MWGARKRREGGTEVAEGVADCGELPVEDADDVGKGFVEDEVVDLVVAVDNG